MPPGLIRVTRQSLKGHLRAKDLWMLRALIFRMRLEHLGQETADVRECKDKGELYMMITKEQNATEKLAESSEEWTFKGREPGPSFPDYDNQIITMIHVAVGRRRISYATSKKGKCEMLADRQPGDRLIGVWTGKWRSDLFNLAWEKAEADLLGAGGAQKRLI